MKTEAVKLPRKRKGSPAYRKKKGNLQNRPRKVVLVGENTMSLVSWKPWVKSVSQDGESGEEREIDLRH